MLIVDLPLPKSCESCKFQMCEFYGKPWQNVAGDRTYKTHRADGCLIKGFADDKLVVDVDRNYRIHLEKATEK